MNTHRFTEIPNQGIIELTTVQFKLNRNFSEERGVDNKRSKMKLNFVSSISLNNEHKLFYPEVKVSLPKNKRGRPSLKSKLFNEQQVQFGSEVVIQDTAEDYIE